MDVDALRTQMQSELTQQLSGVRAEVAEETEDLIAMVGEDLTKRLDRLARQVAAVTSWRDSTDAALTRVDHEIAELSESVKADRATLATHVSQLDSSLARLAEWQAEIEERVGSMVRPARPAPAEPTAPGGGRRKIRGADIERLVESVESWRAESVGEEEFVALRTDLENMVARRIASAQAEMQHLIEMVEAVVADAGADTADTASMRCDLETLQEQVATLLKSRTPPRAKRTPRDSG